MEYFIYIFLTLIYFCSAFDVIPILDYENKKINFTYLQNYSIFSYNYVINHKFAKPSFILKISQTSYYQYYNYYFYIYKSLNQIEIGKSGYFINYLNTGQFSSQYIYNDSYLSNNNTERYYIVIQQEKKMNYNTTFTIFPNIPKYDAYSFIGALILGIGLSLPNIILQIVRRCKNQMTASCFTFTMNIICHFAYGSLICELSKFTGYGTFLVTQMIGGFYLGLCILCLLIALCGGPKSYYYVLYNLCHDLEDSRTLQDVVSYNRKVPPKICVNATASHQESREVWVEYEHYDKAVYRTVYTYYSDGTSSSKEVFDHYEDAYRYRTTHYSEWDRVDNGGGHFHGCPGRRSSRYDKSVEYRTVVTWRKTTEYQYTSWQDETKSLSNIRYCSIVKSIFSSVYLFDDDSLNFIKKIKDDLYREGLTHDTDVNTEEDYTSPGMIYKHNCSLNDEEYQRIKKKFANRCGYFWWFVLFVLGYSSMFEAFARYEVGHENITIRKYISYEDNCRAPYMKEDVNPPSITFNFIYTKIQQKSIEKKIKKGLLDESSLATPLAIID